MFRLIQNEWMKLFKRPGTYIMIGILLFITTAAAGFIKIQELGGTVPDNLDWKRGLQVQNESYHKQLEEMGDAIPREVKDQYKREIAINNYRIEHNISPNEDYSVWSFVKDASLSIDLIGMFTIIIAAGIVANEFNWGTIKFLLIRPIKRERILWSKYLAVLLFGLFQLFILFAYSAGAGAALFGIPENPKPYLIYFNGHVIEQSMPVYLMCYYGVNSIEMLMLATMAFMISAAFRNSSLAIGLSLFLMFTGGQLTRMLAMKFAGAKYLLFANTDLLQYFEGTPMVGGMTLGFSASMLLVYFLLFHVIAFYVFKTRDVSA